MVTPHISSAHRGSGPPMASLVTISSGVVVHRKLLPHGPCPCSRDRYFPPLSPLPPSTSSTAITYHHCASPRNPTTHSLRFFSSSGTLPHITSSYDTPSNKLPHIMSIFSMNGANFGERTTMVASVTLASPQLPQFPLSRPSHWLLSGVRLHYGLGTVKFTWSTYQSSSSCTRHWKILS